LQPTEIITDTAGYADIVFGLFWLLGYQFSPRLADIGDARFWRTDPEADYGPLNGLSKGRIDTNLIAENWDDLLRVAGSLKSGTVSASDFMRTLKSTDSCSTLTKALTALGRIAKTLHLLAYIEDSAHRRKILTQLNRQEGRHAVARAVFHGQLGQLRQSYREGQEDQLGALGLVVNIIVLWNTIYLERALDHLRSSDRTIAPEDEARLSPLQHRNLNMQGRHQFILTEALKHGAFRPLRQLGYSTAP
jgi:TnpA family transposase